MNYETMRKTDGIYDIYYEGNLKQKKRLCSYRGIVYYISGEYATPHDESYNRSLYSFVKVGGVPLFVIKAHAKEVRKNSTVVNYEYLKDNDGVYNWINDEEYEGVLASYQGVVYYINFDHLNVSDGSFGIGNHEFVWAGKVPQKVIDFHNKTHKIDPKKDDTQSDKVKEFSNFLYNSVKLNMSETTLHLLLANYFLDNNLKVEKR